MKDLFLLILVWFALAVLCLGAMVIWIALWRKPKRKAGELSEDWEPPRG